MPRLWNVILSQLTYVADPLMYKNKLTDFLETIPDKPPVIGYNCINGNSIMEWGESKADMTRDVIKMRYMRYRIFFDFPH